MTTATFNAVAAAQASQVTSSKNNIISAIVRFFATTGKSAATQDATWADGARFM